MTSLMHNKFSAIPFLDITNLQGRFISTLTFYDSDKWRMWVVAGDQPLELQGSPIEAFYFSAERQSSDDLWLHFLDFMAQRASFPGLEKPIFGIQDDILNLSVSLAKLSNFHSSRDEIGNGVVRMVATEIEYLFSTCRSIFDLLQEIVFKLWEIIEHRDSSVNKKKIRKKFSEMVLFEGRESTEEELFNRFGLPQQLTEYYTRHAKFFLTLRHFRNNIVHNGSKVQTIFSSETGFLIRNSLKPFSSMTIWKEEEKQPNNLVPLLPALGTVIHNTLLACEDFSSIIEEIVQFPPPIAPNMRLFMRGYFNELFSTVVRDASDRLINSTESKQDANAN